MRHSVLDVLFPVATLCCFFLKVGSSWRCIPCCFYPSLDRWQWFKWLKWRTRMPSIGPNLSTFPRFRSKSAQARILDASKRLSSGVILWYQGGFLLPDLLRKSSVSTILNVESGVSHNDNGAKFEYFPFLPIKDYYGVGCAKRDFYFLINCQC